MQKQSLEVKKLLQESPSIRPLESQSWAVVSPFMNFS